MLLDLSLKRYLTSNAVANTSHLESMAWPFGEAEPVQLFVKMMNSEAPPIEINADANDTIKIVRENSSYGTKIIL